MSARAKRCKVCHELFAPSRPMQTVCGVRCAHALVRMHRERLARKQARDERKADAKRRELLKTTAELNAEAQRAFNSYIRERDRDQPCISCGRTDVSDPLTGGAWDCGHYRSRGSAPHLRFTEDNAHKQCKRCNRSLAGNSVEYRKGLIARIGIERVEALERDEQPRRYRADELRSIRDTYRAKLLALRKDDDVADR